MDSFRQEVGNDSNLWTIKLKNGKELHPKSVRITINDNAVLLVLDTKSCEPELNIMAKFSTGKYFQGRPKITTQLQGSISTKKDDCTYTMTTNSAWSQP